MEKIFIAGIQHDLKGVVYYYGSLLAVSLKDGKDYATGAFIGIGPRYKEIQVLEEALHSNCLTCVTNEKERANVKAVLADLSVLYRQFEFHPVLKECFIYHRVPFPVQIIGDIQTDLTAKGKTTALALLEKIVDSYDKLPTPEFIRMRNDIYEKVKPLLTA